MKHISLTLLFALSASFAVAASGIYNTQAEGDWTTTENWKYYNGTQAENFTYPDNKKYDDYTFNLNIYHSLTVENVDVTVGTMWFKNTTSTITIGDGGKLAVNGGSSGYEFDGGFIVNEGGTLSATGTFTKSILVNGGTFSGTGTVRGATFTVEDGSFTSGWIENDGTTLTINGGKVKTGLINRLAHVTINDGEYDNQGNGVDNAILTISGGEVKNLGQIRNSSILNIASDLDMSKEIKDSTVNVFSGGVWGQTGALNRDIVNISGGYAATNGFNSSTVTLTGGDLIVDGKTMDASTITATGKSANLSAVGATFKNGSVLNVDGATVDLKNASFDGVTIDLKNTTVEYMDKGIGAEPTKITIGEGATFTMNGNVERATIVVDGGTFDSTSQFLHTPVVIVNSGLFKSTKSFSDVTTTLNGGRLELGNMVWRGTTTINSGAVFSISGNPAFDASVINLYGGTLEGTKTSSNSLVFQDGCEVNFGGMVGDKFVAAVAHSVFAQNKIFYQNNGNNVFTFNIGDSNLLDSSKVSYDEKSGKLTADSVRALRDSAFVYSANEMQFGGDQTAVTAVVDFSYIPLDSMDGTYYISFFANEKHDYHMTEMPKFVVKIRGTEHTITGAEFNTQIDISDKESFTVFKDTSYYMYYMAVTIPEPSTYAAILGALALGVVAYRRRRAK